MMEQQQSFSHGLLYSVDPGMVSELHLNDDAHLEELDWDEKHEASWYDALQNFLAVTAKKWGL